MLWTPVDAEKLVLHDVLAASSPQKSRQAIPKPARFGQRHSLALVQSNFWGCCSHRVSRPDLEACCLSPRLSQPSQPSQPSRPVAPVAQSFDLNESNRHLWSTELLATKEAPVLSACTGPVLPIGGAKPQVHVDINDCNCCKAVEVSRRETLPSIDAASTLSLMGHLEEVLEANEKSLPSALLKVFGADGLSAIFGRASADGAKRLHCGGFNHVFMIELGGKLAKCIRPHGGAGGDCSEVLESERLRHHFPSLCQDHHVLFPRAAFLCKGMASTRYICEVMVFDFIRCQSVGDLCRNFERTHPWGVRRQTAACPEHRAFEEDKANCEHFRALQALMRQAARLGRHFQHLHGRRHGDFKADNILVDQNGKLLLSDFLSPFCSACDRSEFRTSIQSGHPVCQDLQQAFEEEWQASGCQLPNEAQRQQVAWLADEMHKLNEASSKQSLFGPLPDLLQSISAWSSPAMFTGAAEKLPAESPNFTQLASPTISSGFSWFESSHSSTPQRTHKAWGHANTAPLAGAASSPVPMKKGFFTEPNLLEHAKLIIAATQDSPATSTWQTPSWAGSSLSSPTPTWSQPGFRDATYTQEGKSAQRLRRSSAPSPFFPSNDLIAMHKASLRLGEVPRAQP